MSDPVDDKEILADKFKSGEAVNSAINTKDAGLEAPSTVKLHPALYDRGVKMVELTQQFSMGLNSLLEHDEVPDYSSTGAEPILVPCTGYNFDVALNSSNFTTNETTYKEDADFTNLFVGVPSVRLTASNAKTSFSQDVVKLNSIQRQPFLTAFWGCLAPFLPRTLEEIKDTVTFNTKTGVQKIWARSSLMDALKLVHKDNQRQILNILTRARADVVASELPVSQLFQIWGKANSPQDNVLMFKNESQVLWQGLKLMRGLTAPRAVLAAVAADIANQVYPAQLLIPVPNLVDGNTYILSPLGTDDELPDSNVFTSMYVSSGVGRYLFRMALNNAEMPVTIFATQVQITNYLTIRLGGTISPSDKACVSKMSDGEANSFIKSIKAFAITGKGSLLDLRTTEIDPLYLGISKLCVLLFVSRRFIAFCRMDPNDDEIRQSFSRCGDAIIAAVEAFLLATHIWNGRPAVPVVFRSSFLRSTFCGFTFTRHITSADVIRSNLEAWPMANLFNRICLAAKWTPVKRGVASDVHALKLMELLVSPQNLLFLGWSLLQVTQFQASDYLTRSPDIDDVDLLEGRNMVYISAGGAMSAVFCSINATASIVDESETTITSWITRSRQAFKPISGMPLTEQLFVIKLHNEYYGLASMFKLSFEHSCLVYRRTPSILWEDDEVPENDEDIIILEPDDLLSMYNHLFPKFMRFYFSGCNDLILERMLSYPQFFFDRLPHIDEIESVILKVVYDQGSYMLDPELRDQFLGIDEEGVGNFMPLQKPTFREVLAAENMTQMILINGADIQVDSYNGITFFHALGDNVDIPYISPETMAYNITELEKEHFVDEMPVRMRMSTPYSFKFIHELVPIKALSTLFNTIPSMIEKPVADNFYSTGLSYSNVTIPNVILPIYTVDLLNPDEQLLAIRRKFKDKVVALPPRSFFIRQPFITWKTFFVDYCGEPGAGDVPTDLSSLAVMRRSNNARNNLGSIKTNDVLKIDKS